MKRILNLIILTVTICVLFPHCSQQSSTVERLCSDLKFENPRHGFVSARHATNWEESMISGNGTLGVLVPGKTNNDRIVLSHERLFMPKFEPYPAPALGSRMAETRELILQGQYEKAANILVEEGGKVGIDRMIWTNPHIPACQIEFESLKPMEEKAYARSVNFETGEVKVALSDGNNIIHRDAFVSRTDQVVVVKFSSPNDTKLNYKFRLH